MNKAVAKRWTRALRSKKYTQGQFALRVKNIKDSSNTYCCLGVLTDLYIKEHKTKWVEGEVSENTICYAYGKKKSTDDLSPAVMKWAGINNEAMNTLITYNDRERFNFKKIANIIDKTLCDPKLMLVKKKDQLFLFDKM